VAAAKTVLVVSIDREYHDLYATALSLIGYRVLRTTDAQDALALVLAKRPQLVILQYPVRLGESTLTASIRAVPELARTRILNITPRNLPEALARALVEGVDVNLVMPVAPNRLLEEVKALIGAPG
jgi:DNA-binding response OmpR family regulator